MVYRWKDTAAPTHKLAAQVVGEHLEQLRVQHGGITAEIVLWDASREGSPITPAFEWDDTKAAHEYRLQQARNLVNHIVVLREDGQLPTRAFVFIESSGDDGQYQSVEVALSDVDMRREVLERALKELEAFRRKYAELTELARVFAAIDLVGIVAPPVEAPKRQRRKKEAA